MLILRNAVWASEGRSSFHAYVFLREVLKYCENKPEVIVDRGFWYLWALKRLGLRYRHETFGKRNAVEGFFSRLKERTKRFWNRFPFRSSFESVQSWRALWLCIIIGGVYFDSLLSTYACSCIYPYTFFCYVKNKEGLYMLIMIRMIVKEVRSGEREV